MAVSNPRLPAERGFDAADEIITTHVGGPPTSYFIHRSVLCSSGHFFKTRLKPEWSRTDEAHAKLPVQEPDAFNLYVNWLYMRGIPLTAPDKDDDAQHRAEWKNLAAAFVVGEAVMDDPFKDAIMDALCAKARSPKGATLWAVMNAVVQTLYDGAPPSSPARKWLLAVFIHHAPDDALDPNTGDLPKHFVWDLARAHTDGRKPLSVMELGSGAALKCTYHSHGEAEECPLAKKEG
ncbi:hypothetical protein LTR85_000786 [Meristemomyces frigidus]|nr:hypothetical protein LTR85_000786 [Meristemomyces frigidus]